MSRFQMCSTLVLCGALGLFATPATAQFDASNVELRSWFDLSTLNASSGNDCWGYVSASGREYALMGLYNKMTVVEVTDPANAFIVASIAHTGSTWCDIKVYRDYAYVVNESGGGIQVVDLSDVDNGQVTLVRAVSSPPTSHNIALDTASGYLYTCGSRGGAASTVIFDLSNPANPAQVGTWTGAYEHDAQVVTYTDGPYAGRQILFGSSEGRGIDVVDVSNKSSTFLVSRTPYSNVAYCHQAWTGDLQYLYINDELDSINRTTVMDISDLDNPVVVGEFNSGVQATDHNVYVREGFLYESEYHSGLRVFDLRSDPVNPELVAWFDTYPANDNEGFDGAWSVYPFFPSGTVLISDINRGLFVVEVVLENLLFDFPDGLPTQLLPNQHTPITTLITEDGTTLDPDTVQLHVSRNGDAFTDIPMQPQGGGTFTADIPAGECFDAFEYYVSAADTNGTLFTSPGGAPDQNYQATVYTDVAVALDEPLDVSPGWTTQGLWAFGQPRGFGGQYGGPDPTSGHTDTNVYGYNLNGDYENNLPQRHLTTAAIDCSDLTGVRFSFWRWLGVEQPAYDHAYIRVSNNGTNWTTLWQNTAEVTDAAWVYQEFDVSSVADGQPTVYLRWTMGPTDSAWRYCGWNIDDVQVLSLACEAGCAGDLDGDGDTDQADLGILLASFGINAGGDLDNDGDTDREDLGILLSDWGCGL